MKITNAFIFRLGAADDETKKKIYNAGIDYAAVIKRAKELLLWPQGNETVTQLDDVIGECSLPAAKIIHGDAMQLE